MYATYLKRFFDFFISLLLLPFLLLISIPIGIASKLEDGGSIFYCGLRYGRHMIKFRMYKFRTMKMNAPDIRNTDGSTFNSIIDPRLTKVGSFLRITSLDELPQIINVLLGDMSLIGPRPSPLGNENTYTDYVMTKFKVRPGITGYNQALRRNASTLSERYFNDVYYVNNLSFFLDVKIFLLTAKNVLLRKNVFRS